MREDALAAAYLAGFMASGEGWNGEYPFEGYPDNHPEMAPVRERAASYARRAAKATRSSSTPSGGGDE